MCSIMAAMVVDLPEPVGPENEDEAVCASRRGCS